MLNLGESSDFNKSSSVSSLNGRPCRRLQHIELTLDQTLTLTPTNPDPTPAIPTTFAIESLKRPPRLKTPSPTSPTHHQLTPAHNPPIMATTDLPLRQQPTQSSFDIVATYRDLLARQPELTKPVAAIEALIELLNTVPFSTIHEFLETIRDHSTLLKTSVDNPLPLIAGTDLFLHYIVSSLKQQEGSFDAVRHHLLRNGEHFANRAIASRAGVAEAGWRYVTQDKVVITHGASRSVTGVLEKAAKACEAADQPVNFQVVYVRDEARPLESDAVVKQMRALKIPVAEVAEAAVAHVMDMVRRRSFVMVGAEAVTSNGGIITRMGTFQIAQLASKAKIPFYVCAETHKFVRKFPHSQKDVGFHQNVLDFQTENKSAWPKDTIDYTVSFDGLWLMRKTSIVERAKLTIYRSLPS